MIVDFDLPDVPEPTTAISDYWNRYFFIGSPSQNAQVNALASTYMRLVEGSTVEYGLGCSALRQVWSDHTSMGLRAMHRSISHFENCVTGMHRAIAAYRRLRNHSGRDPLSVYLAEVKPAFLSDKIASPVRHIRDAVHHLEEKVVKGEIAEGQPFALRPDGEEVPHATELGQTIKTFDRLVIGPHQLTFSDIATSLSEMAAVAAKISQFPPRQSAASPWVPLRWS
jgi:hypothetical protein